jgi:hypothetical protein
MKEPQNVSWGSICFAGVLDLMTPWYAVCCCQAIER